MTTQPIILLAQRSSSCPTAMQAESIVKLLGTRPCLQHAFPSALQVLPGAEQVQAFVSPPIDVDSPPHGMHVVEFGAK